jgi:hypothetical protein
MKKTHEKTEPIKKLNQTLTKTATQEPQTHTSLTNTMATLQKIVSRRPEQKSPQRQNSPRQSTHS